MNDLINIKEILNMPKIMAEDVNDDYTFKGFMFVFGLIAMTILLITYPITLIFYLIGLAVEKIMKG